MQDDVHEEGRLRGRRCCVREELRAGEQGSACGHLPQDSSGDQAKASAAEVLGRGRAGAFGGILRRRMRRSERGVVVDGRDLISAPLT